jgi:uncharacterized protein YgiM (DUF1202 family)
LRNIPLRSDSNKKAEQIGWVNKDTRLKIENSDSGWYKVTIVGQNGQPDGSVQPNQGWISGKSADGDDNIKLSR